MDTDSEAKFVGSCDLHRAICSGSLERVKELVAHGANIEGNCWVGDYACTPLMYSSEKGHLEITRFLIERGAAVNAQIMILTSKSVTLHTPGADALTFALLSDHLDIADLLVQNGADLTKRYADYDETLLMGIVLLGSLRSIDFVLKQGVDVNERDNLGRTALDYALAMKREPEIIELLKAAGATL